MIVALVFGASATVLLVAAAVRGLVEGWRDPILRADRDREKVRRALR